MKRIIPLLFIGVLLLSGCSEEVIPDHPNVLFIICDDLNDYESVLDGHVNIKTPHIDRLAAQGTCFSNAHTNVGLCQPSRNSLFSGVYPHTTKDFGWTPHHKNPLLRDNKTMFELFRENDYYMLGTGKLHHKETDSVWDEWGIKRGINYGPFVTNGVEKVGHPSVPEAFRKINNVDGSFASLADVPTFGGAENAGWTYGKEPFRYVSDDDRDLMPDELHAQWAVQKLAELEERSNAQPFFLGVGFVKPHTPLYAPQKYFDMFPLDEIQLPVMLDGDGEDCYYRTVYPDTDVGLHYYQALKEAYPEGDEGIRKFMQAYLACVAFVDDQIGVVLEALEQSKFNDNTIVVLTSDHGWQMGQKEYLYKNSPWEEATRIPLLIKDPYRSEPGSEVVHPVSLIDIFPTLMDVCNLKGTVKRKEQANEIEGFSLKPFLEDPETADWEGPDGALTLLGARINTPIEGLGIQTNPKALWHVEIRGELPDSTKKQQNYSYRTKDWRYIMYSNGKEELYDHRTDPEEWNNLSGDTKYELILGELKSEVLELINN